MRVLHVFKTYLPDSFTGIERVIWQIAEGTKPLGVESDVFSLSKTDRPGPSVVGQHLGHTAKLDLYLASTGLSLSAFGKFTELARNADLIHYHFPWPMMDLLHFWARANKPGVITYHSDIVRQRLLGKLYRPLMNRFLGSVDRIVATSPNYLASSPVLKGFTNKTTVIPIGLDEAGPVPVDLVEHWRCIVPERFFLFVAALRYYKGLQFLIDAARQTGLPVVVGGSGDMEEALREANLPNVQLVGKLSEMDKLALLQREPIIRRLPDRVALFLITLDGGEDYLDLETHGMGKHYHYLNWREQRSNVILCWDTRWQAPDPQTRPPTLRALFVESHGEKTNADFVARPDLWRAKKRASMYEACVPDLAKSAIEEFKCAANKSQIVYPPGRRLTPHPAAIAAAMAKAAASAKGIKKRRR